VGKPVGKNHLAKIIPIRVSLENWEQIRKEADRMGIGVSTLTRIWIMDYLQKLTNEKLQNER
jgi:hypothetical protein